MSERWHEFGAQPGAYGMVQINVRTTLEDGSVSWISQDISSKDAHQLARLIMNAIVYPETDS